MGGSNEVRLPKADFEHVKAAGKPSTMKKSTVNGTKDYACLNPTIIAAIKGIRVIFPFITPVPSAVYTPRLFPLHKFIFNMRMTNFIKNY